MHQLFKLFDDFSFLEEELVGYSLVYVLIDMFFKPPVCPQSPYFYSYVHVCQFIWSYQILEKPFTVGHDLWKLKEAMCLCSISMNILPKQLHIFTNITFLEIN